jgi:aarF domain-containing kinase
VYPEYSTKKVMVAEWIDGVRLSDKEGIFRLMGERSLSLPPSPSDPYSATALVSSPPMSPASSLHIPAKPLKGGVQAIMQTMVELFSAQMFEWGWVHCDPHPGNVLVRPSPLDPRKPQLVLLDHGLYVRVPEDFKRDWVRLWRAMLAGDYRGVEDVTKGWGFGLPDLMASFTLMRPTILQRGRKRKDEVEEKPEERKPLTQYEISVKMKEKLKEFLTDTDRMPKVLIFLTRNMRMVQGSLLFFSFLSFFFLLLPISYDFTI